jgi:hypothetical protein
MTSQNDDDLSVETVAVLGAYRLAKIVVDHALHDSGLTQALRMALATEGSDDELIRILASEIDAMRSDRRFYDYRESRILAHEIDRIRTAIMRDLLPRAPRAAADLLKGLIQLDSHVFEHADDSDGVVGSALADAVVDFGCACAAAPGRDAGKLAAEIFVLFSSDDYGVRGDIIAACKDALGPSGLDELERLMRADLEGVRAASGGDQRHILLHGLAEIADARSDVDGFIDAQRLAGSEDRAVIEISERLVGAGRLEEALRRLERAEGGNHRLGQLEELKIEILSKLGRGDEAQAVRWGTFLRSLSDSILSDYLAQLPEAARSALTDNAIATARHHRDVHCALALLTKLAPADAAHLVSDRLAELNGDLYFILRPAAERLADAYPLASVLLRRRLADAVLTRAQSQHYGHAVLDLAAAEKSAAQVLDWRCFFPQDAYRQQISLQHRQKSAFWRRMNEFGLRWRERGRRTA